MRITGRERCKRRHRGQADPAAVREALREEPEERRKDAEAICEAMSRPTMRFVPVKNVEQQDIQAIHRVRAGVDRATDCARRIRSEGWWRSTVW